MDYGILTLLPFSTWAIFFSSLFFAEQGVSELGLSNAIDTFVHVIPYVFYAIAAVGTGELFLWLFWRQLSHVLCCISPGKS